MYSSNNTKYTILNIEDKENFDFVVFIIFDFRIINILKTIKKIINVKIICVTIVKILLTRAYRIGIAKNINGENMDKVLRDGNISNLYKSIGNTK